MGIELVGRGCVLVAAALALSACGGNGTGESPAEPYNPRGEFELLNRASNNIANTTDMPVSGTAAYRGSGYLVLARPLSTGFDDSFAGRVDLVADFGNQTISGQMGQFLSSSNQRIDGTLDVGVGRVEGNRVGPFTVTGELSLNGDQLDLELVGDGRFVGPNAQYLRMGVSGPARSGGGSTIAAGSFVAEQR